MATRLNLPPDGRRLIYDLAEFGIPEIPYLAAQNLPFTTAALPMHTHGARMEINHIIKGERVYHVDGTDYHLRGNQIFITWPNEMHGSGSYLHGRGLHFWMQVVIPKPGKSFLGFSAERAAPLLSALWSMPRRQFKSDPAMRELYSRMLILCQKGPSPLRATAMSALLAQWFLLLAESSTAEYESEITPDIARALELMEQGNGGHGKSIGELAEAACLSESRFKGKFKEQLGVPPGEYLLRRRVETAAEELAKKRTSLTELAFESGFSSAQHFSATFKKFFGQSPLRWLKIHDAEILDRNLQFQATADEKDDLRPWLDADGVLHGYVPHSNPIGIHPNC